MLFSYYKRSTIYERVSSESVVRSVACVWLIKLGGEWLSIELELFAILLADKRALKHPGHHDILSHMKHSAVVVGVDVNEPVRLGESLNL